MNRPNSSQAAVHLALVRSGTVLELSQVATQAPPPGGLLIAPSFVGVCGTDLQILNGSRPDTAKILGHEAAGVVVRAGLGATVTSGTRVVFNPSAQLTRGRILGHNVDGLFQQYFVADSQAVEDGLVQPVEAGLPAICGALVEPVGGIIYTYQLIRNVVPSIESVVVFGAGPIGLIAAEYLRQQGARVLVVHTSQRRLQSAMAIKMLDAECSMVIAADSSQHILHWNGGHPLDAAVICTSMAGASTALKCAVEVVREGACIEMVTNYPESSATPEGITARALRDVRAANICGVPAEGAYVRAEISGRKIYFASHRGTSRSHLTSAMQVLKQHAQRYTALITHILPLDQAVNAIQALSESRSGAIDGRDCIKAVIDLTSRSSEGVASIDSAGVN